MNQYGTTLGEVQMFGVGVQAGSGAPGATGPTGPQGPAGVDGSNGSGGVASLAAGFITTGGSTGSVTVNNGASTATVDVNFPISSIYGDGSDGTAFGVCYISGDTDWVANPPNDIQCSSFTINTGATLTVPSGTIIRSTGNVEIDGTIRVQPGAAQGLFASAPDLFQRLGGSLYGGGVALSTSALRRIVQPGIFGGGNGGYGTASAGLFGLGGGSLEIVAHGPLDVGSNGLVQAQGGAGQVETVSNNSLNDGGGGGGILILASSAAMTNNGILDVTGGQGANFDPTYQGGGGGGGGGGIIHMFAPYGQVTQGTTSLSGGAKGTSYGQQNTRSGGGGASGGNGGSQAAGSTGVIFTTYVADPTTLFLH